MAVVNMDLGKESYKIEIERGLLPHIGEKIRKLTKAQKIAVITDNHVQAIYGDKIRESLQQGDFHVRIIEMPAGEENKNIHVLEGVYNELCDFNLSRDDAIVTFSGGVPGDLGGFAAASYMRGVPFFQVPTTILAQIDSSVGGKVAIDLPGGKNLAGAFYQPKGVFIDPDLLDTLPTRYVHDGLAEALKYGCIGDPELFELLENIGIGGVSGDRPEPNNKEQPDGEQPPGQARKNGAAVRLGGHGWKGIKVPERAGTPFRPPPSRGR